MKTTILCLIFFSLANISDAQKLEFEDFVLYENCPLWVRVGSFGLNSDFIVTRDLNPFYLEADFDGGGKPDVALFVKERITEKRGILIIHFETKQFFHLGCGKDIGHGGDDWKWIDVWKIYREKTAERTLFKDNNDIDGSETVELANVAIEISRSEASSNLIMWDGSNYRWIHTGD